MSTIWRWIMHWWRGPAEPDSAGTLQARKRLDEVSRDDVRVKRLDERVQRVRKENHLGPAISRALRARRP